MSDENIRKIQAQFRKEMGRLGLGVKIKAGDGEWVTITEPPTKKKPARRSR